MGWDSTFFSLSASIEALNLAKGTTPARAVFGSVSALLTTIRVRIFPFCGGGLRVHVYPGLDD